MSNMSKEKKVTPTQEEQIALSCCCCSQTGCIDSESARLELGGSGEGVGGGGLVYSSRAVSTMHT